MLPPFIIEQIRKREEEQRRQDDPLQPLQLPLPGPGSYAPRKRDGEAPSWDPPETDGDRGVVIIDLGA